MREPVWLLDDLAIAIHDEQLRLYGGSDGLRDPGVLGRAQKNRFHYDQGDMAALAAAYAFGIANNHAFVDGNKRTAFLAIVTFLGLNDIDFDVPEAEAVIIIRDLAAGEIDEAGLTRWITDNLPEA